MNNDYFTNFIFCAVDEVIKLVSIAVVLVSLLLTLNTLDIYFFLLSLSLSFNLPPGIKTKDLPIIHGTL